MAADIFPTGNQGTFPQVVRIVTNNKITSEENPLTTLSQVEQRDLRISSIQTELLQGILKELKTMNFHLANMTDEEF